MGYLIYLQFFKNIEGMGNNNSQEKLNNTLIKITNLLNENNIHDWFIGYGTLLGIVREDSCIENDDDIDIIVNVKEKDKIHNILKNEGFTLDHHTCDRIIKTNETDEYASVDFYLSEVDNKGNFKDNWENVLWSNCYNSEQKLIIYQWKTTYLHLPNDYKTKLVNRYGEDWKTPQDTKGPNPPKEII
jgi:phosphorylcholine metabolism protein LicD|tara:strand:- start:45 stop:605 length:561 start_codon:yes stop_codon:yes gene_type:complete